MSIIGGAWTPNIIWYLRGGARRFSELRTDIPRITAKVLTMRLRDLEMHGVIERRVMPTSPPSVEYRLTDLGEELVPAIESIARVGEKLKHRAPRPDRPEERVVPARHFRAPVLDASGGGHS